MMFGKGAGRGYRAWFPFSASVGVPISQSKKALPEAHSKPFTVVVCGIRGSRNAR